MLLAQAAFGLTPLPVLRTHRPHLPLDSVQLTLPRSTFDSLGHGERKRLGLMLDNEQAACGVVCEVSDCGLATGGDSVLVRGVAFSRFRTNSTTDRGVVDGQQQPITWCSVEPWRDEREGRALAALEKRVHLKFLRVEQLLAWSGDGVATSARAALLSEAELHESHRAIHRFAPSRSERIAATEDGCVAEDECAIDGESDACLLERAYLKACAPDEGAGEADDFASSRQELYSYAVCRLFDVAPAEAWLLSGRSGTARLLHAERELGRASAWLSQRMGLGDASAPLEVVGGADDRRWTGLRGLLKLWGRVSS